MVKTLRDTMIDLTPGTWVRHPDRPDWGLGQVQSSVDGRVTVNFEDAGKQLINIAVVSLETVDLRRPKR